PVGPNRTADAHVLEQSCKDRHRVLDPRVLGIGLDALELGFRANALHLELGDEHGQLTSGARDERDRPFCSEKAEAREVLDVLLVEEDVASKLLLPEMIEQAFPACTELLTGDAGWLDGGELVDGGHVRDHSQASVVARTLCAGA